MAPMWKKLMKHVDFDEPTPFLDHVYLGCTQRECELIEYTVEKHKDMFGSRTSAGATEKLPGWWKPHCLFVHIKQKLFLSVYVDDIKMAGKNQNLAPMWKKFTKKVDLDEPTSFLDHVHLGCTQRECEPNKGTVEKCKDMFESSISAGATSKFTRCDKNYTKTAAWSYDMEGHAEKCVERYCESANKKAE